MNISELKSKALNSLKGNWGAAIGLTIVAFFINFFLVTGVEIYLSGGYSNWADPDYTSNGASMWSALISLMLIPFSIGIYWFFLSLIRGEKPGIANAFSLYGNLSEALKMIGASLVQGFFLFFWTLLLIVPGIIKSMSYSQLFYLFRDHPEYSILEAITESRRRMDGLKMKFFLLNLSFIGWGILALFTLGIGFVWLVPYMSATLATFYQELIADKKELF